MILPTNKSVSLGTYLGVCVSCLGLLLTGCNGDNGIFDDGDEADVQYDEDVDFEQFSTFAFEEREEIQQDAFDGLREEQQDDLDYVNDQIRDELTEIGLREADPEDADLLVFSLARTDADNAVVWDCVAGNWGGYWYWGYRTYDPCAWYERETFAVTDRTIVVGLADPEREETVFVGVFDGIEADAAERREAIEEGVDDVFDEYPAEPDPVPEAGMREGGMADAGADADVGDADAGGEDDDDGLIDDGGLIDDSGLIEEDVFGD